MGHREAIGVIEEKDRLLVVSAMVLPADSGGYIKHKPSQQAAADASDDTEADQEIFPVPRITFSSPSPPVVKLVGTTDASLEWLPVQLAEVDPPLHDGSSADSIDFSIEYILEYQEAQPAKEMDSNGHQSQNKNARPRSDTWTVAYRGDSLSCQVTTLRPGRRYTFQLRCNPTVAIEDADVEPIQPSPRIEVATEPTPPHALQPPSLSNRARNALKLKWSLPEETGGLPILDYTLFMRPPPPGHEGPKDAEGFVEVYAGEERSYRVTGLRPGMRFTFRVQAANKLGLSPMSMCSVFTTQASVPGTIAPPEEVGRTPSSVSLRWQPPEDNGSPVASYTVELDDGLDDSGGFRIAYVGTAPHCSIPNLKSGLTYRFRLRADNDEGRGNWCVPFSASTAASNPGSPSTPSLVGANRTSATLSWSPPDDNGGSEVQLYELELLPKSSVAQQQLGSDWLVVFRGPTTAHTVPTLLPGCSYMVRVRAINQAGPGPFSAALQIQSAPDVPHTPSPLQLVAAHTHSITVQWQPPQHDGGTPITSYRLEMSLTHPPSSHLHPSTSYDPLDIGDPEYYCVYSGEECAAEVEGLAPGAHYLFRVSAVNAQGGSIWSHPVLLTTRAAPPLPPPAPHAAASSSSSVALKWAAPDCQGAQVAGYQVEAAALHTPANGGCSTSDAASAEGARLCYAAVYRGAALQCEAKGLEPFTQYAFRVRASNSVGPGPWSPEARARTQPAAPAAPTCLQATGVSSSSIELRWSAPLSDHGAEVTSYVLETQAAAAASSRSKGAATSWQRTWQGPQCHCTVDQLKPGRRYTFRVKAVNSRGVGCASDPTTTSTTASPPGAPDKVVVTQRAANFVRVKWEFPAQDNGAPVEFCMLEMAGVDGQFRAIYTGTETSHRVQGLQPLTQYMFRAAAFNVAGQGPYSEVEAVSTVTLPPPPPQDVDVVVELDGGDDAGTAALEGGYGLPHIGLAVSVVVSVRWDPPVAVPQCAKVLMYEVEVAEVEGELRVWKQNGGHDGLCKLVGLPTGTALAVRMRSVGVEGSGHSPWTVGVRVQTPGPKHSTLVMYGESDIAAAGSKGGRRPGKGKGKGRAKHLRSSDSDDASSISTAAAAVATAGAGAGAGQGSKAGRALGAGSAVAKLPSKKRKKKMIKDLKFFAMCVLGAALALFLIKLLIDDHRASAALKRRAMRRGRPG